MRPAARPIRRKSPRRCSPAFCSRPPTRAMSCSTRSSAPARPARSPKRLGRDFIGIERDEAYAEAARRAHRRGRAAAARGHRRRAEPALRAARRLRRHCRGGPDRARRRAVRRKAAPSRRRCAPTERSRSAPSSARSTRSARWRRACRPATAGPSGITVRMEDRRRLIRFAPRRESGCARRERNRPAHSECVAI